MFGHASRRLPEPALRLACLLLLAQGCAPAPEPAAAATCEAEIRNHGWCEARNVGFVAAIEIESPLLYESVDAHGHDIDPTALKCESCQRALAADGYCHDHRMGFINGRAYLSPLTYHLFQGAPLERSELDCSRCQGHVDDAGWCDVHQRGIVGRTVIRDRTGFDQLEASYRRLEAAVAKARECDICAAAMMVDGTCHEHRILYKDGRPTGGSP